MKCLFIILYLISISVDFKFDYILFLILKTPIVKFARPVVQRCFPWPFITHPIVFRGIGFNLFSIDVVI